MLHDVVMKFDYITKVWQESHECDVRLLVEAKWLLKALDSSLTPSVERWLLTDLSANFEMVIKLLNYDMWLVLSEELFGVGGENQGDANMWFRDFEHRIQEGRPWYEIVGPLADRHGCRPEWIWRAIRRIIENDIEAMPRFYAAFREYERWREVPSARDHVVEIQFSNKFDSSMEIRNLVYRRVAEYEDIVTRRCFAPKDLGF